MARPVKQLQIIAQPRAFFRERYESERRNGKKLIQRYIMADSNESKLKYPTIKVKDPK